MRLYNVRYVHKISPKPSDTAGHIFLEGKDLKDRSALGRKLRSLKILGSGGRIENYRVEKDGKVIAFPSMPGLTTYWHSIVLTPV